MVKKYLLLAIILLLLFSTGCWDQREMNDSAVPTTIGIDLGENKKIIFSSLFAEPTQPGESGSQQMKTILTTGSDYSVALAARRVMLSLSRVPELTHVQSLVLGETLARNDLPLAIDFMIRNRNINPDMGLLIALRNHPEEILAQVNSTGSGLKQLVEVNEFELGIYVPITMGDFTYKLLTPGIEPAVPEIIIEEIPAVKTKAASGDKNGKPTDNKTKRIVLHGTAVFKGDKMLGSLNEIESRGYRWLSSQTKAGGLLVVKYPLNPQDYMVLEIMNFSSKTRPQVSGNIIKMHVDINAQLNFYEQTGSDNMLTPALLKRLEQTANLEIARQINSCIRKSQSLNSDILGWGLLLLEYQPDAWKRLKADWNDIYPAIEFDVKAKTTITHTYLSNKSLQIR